MASDPLDRKLGPLARRVASMVARAVVKVVDEAKKMQLVQVVLSEGETRDEVERPQNYGFSSVPLDGAEAVVVFVGGRRDHGLAIAVDDRRYRIRNLESGEVAVYDRTGSKIVLKANGDIELTPSSGTAKFVGDVSVTGTLTATTDVIGGGKSLKTHSHLAGALLTGPSPGAPVTGLTGAPT